MVGLLAALFAVAHAAPMVQQGRITDALGAPVEGSQTLGVYLYSAPDAAAEDYVWFETQTVPVSNGYYSLVLGSGANEAVVDHEALWVELRVGTNVLGVRQPIGAVPYSVSARSGGNGAPANALESCEAILAADATAATGLHWIDPTGDAPFQVWCEEYTRFRNNAFG